LGAESGLRNYIFQSNTNIDIEGLDNDLYVDEILWKNITSIIINYGEFRHRLDSIIREIMEQKKLNMSIGAVLSGLIEKGYALIEKINLADPEEIKEMQGKSAELLKELSNSSVLKDAQMSTENVKPGKI
jgi:hypothetical protein